jgi:hypothetical protein
LKRRIVRQTASEIELRGMGRAKIVIEVHVASYRSLRGYTLLAFIADEISFWRTGEEYSEPDLEVIRSVRPAMITVPNALLLGLSSPYARKGELWRVYEKHFGKEESRVLVWQAMTEAMNPAVDQAVILAAYEEDSTSAMAEYFAQFRADVESYVSREAVEACIITDRLELPYAAQFRYSCFVDPSGGQRDSFTLGIAHKEGERIILDCLRETKAPFNPDVVVAEYSALAKVYRCSSVVGDRYAGSWVETAFKKHGISYKQAEKTKSDIYIDGLPALNAGRVELLDVPRLKSQLLALERRSGRGKDIVDHPPRGFDDVVNAAMGAIVEVGEQSRYASKILKLYGA